MTGTEGEEKEAREGETKSKSMSKTVRESECVTESESSLLQFGDLDFICAGRLV